MPASDIDVKLAIKGELQRALADIQAAIADMAYAHACAVAAETRLSRAIWPHLPVWRRFWLTLRRQGW